MNPEEEAIERIAESIADGKSADSSKSDEETLRDSGILADLITLSKLSDYHRPPSVAEDDGPTPETWGALRILERIGSGAFGSVFRAWDPDLQRQVALKLFHSREEGGRDEAPRAETLMDEGRRLARVDHSGVVRVHGAASHGGRTGLWMELIEGESLAARLARQGRLDPAEVGRIGWEAAEALTAVHAAGVVHGDLKPANVMRTAESRFVLTDFGSGSRPDIGHEPTAAQTATALYLAPERLDGEPADPRTDLYALGVLLFHLLTERHPVEATTWEDLRAAHDSGRRNPLPRLRPEIPADLVAILERACAPDPAERFSSAAELALALRPLVADKSISSPRPTARRIGRRIVLIGGIATVALAVGLLRDRPVPEPPLVGGARLLRGVSAPTELLSGDRVLAGDVLQVRLDLSRPAHVYAVNRDGAGRVVLLFPLPGWSQQNPLPAGDDLAIPGHRADDGTARGWVLGPAAGRERFLVLASESPLLDFEAELARLPGPGDSPRPLDRRALDVLFRGVVGTAELPTTSNPVVDGGTRVFDMAARLGESRRSDAGIWARDWVLEGGPPESRAH